MPDNLASTTVENGSEAGLVPEPAQAHSSPENTIWDDSIVPDDLLWLDDGNIVLVAGNAAFKVYQGLLAAQSPVFADILSTASPDTAQELYNGTPAVRLYDSPTDIKFFLQALLPTADIDIYRRSDHRGYDFERLFSVTRLANKYQFVALEQQAIECLKEYFTHKFEVWEQVNRHRQVIELEEYTTSIAVVRLARLTGNFNMLPIALCDCVMAGDDIADGWVREDGSVEHLDEDDLERCKSASRTIHQERNEILGSIHSSSPSTACLTPDQCTNSHIELRRTAVDGGEWWMPLASESYFVTDPAWSGLYPMCSECRDAFIERDREVHHALWRRLPSLFNLSIEGWDED